MLCNNKKCEIQFKPKTSNQKFCSIRCRNQQNTRNWKKANASICKKCQKKIKPGAKYCKKCLGILKSEKYKNKTIKDYQEEFSLIKKHPSWAYAQIRQFAHSWNKNLLSCPCQKCGYNLHIELAHIKHIPEFNPNTKIKIVNHESNLLVLCPNHHWEFDNNYLKLEEIPNR